MKKTTDMNQTVLTVSLKEYKTQLDNLRASLATLDKTSQQYKKTCDEIRDKQERLDEAMAVGRKNNEALEGSYNAIAAEMAKLRKEWKATNDEGKRNELGKQIQALNTQLKDFDSSIGNHQRNVGDYAIATKSLKQELKELQAEMAQMLQNGVDPASESYQRLAERAGSISDSMSDARNSVRQFADDTKTMTGVISIAQAGVSAFGAWKGALSAIGVESEGTAKAIQKMQGIMTLLNSLQTIQTALFDKGSKAYLFMASIVNKLSAARKADTVATQAMTTATVAQTTATGAATVATKAFSKALISTGIGAFVVLIGTLVANLESVVGWFEKLIGKSKDTKESLEELNTVMEANSAAVDSMASSIESINSIDVKIGAKTEIESLTSSIETLNTVLANDTNSAIRYLDMLASHKGLDDTSKAVLLWGKAFEDSAKQIDFSKASVQDINEWLRKESITVSELNGYIVTLTKLQEASTGEQKKRVSVAKAAAKAMLEQYEAAMKLAQGLANLQAQEKKENDDAEKKAEEERKKAEQEAQKRRDAAARSQQEAYRRESKGQAIIVDNLNRDINRREKRYELETKLLKVEGRLTKEEERQREIGLFDLQVKGLKEQVELYEKLSKSAKLDADTRQGYAKMAADGRVKIEEAAQQRIIIVTEQSNNRIKENWEKVLENWNQTVENWLEANEFYDRQIVIGIKPIMTLPKGYNSPFLDEIKEQIQDIFKDVNSSLDFNLFDSKEVIQEQYKKSLDVERSYSEELKGIRKSRSEDALAIEMRLLKDRNNLIVGGYEGEIDKIRENAEKEGRQLTADEAKRIAYLNENINKAYSDYYISLADLQDRWQEMRKKNHKAYVQAMVSSTFDMVDSISSLMGNISEIMEQNIEQRVKNGKISEEEAEKEFERVKKVQLAELWMSTLAGAGGAFLQDMKSYPSPFNVLIAGVDFATAMAMGIAQTNKIKQQTFGGAGTGGATVAQAQVTPLLNDQLDSQSMSALNLQTVADNSVKESRVYILESDLQKSSSKVETREKNSSF